MTGRSTYSRVGGRMYSSWLSGNIVIYPEGLGPANAYFVDGSKSSSGDGLSWERAFMTIMEAMDAITARGVLRGRSVVYVAPGGYNEDVVTPLNSIAPFGQLIGVNPTDRSFGGAYIYAATAGQPALTVRARGWLIKGFEFGALANAECIVLDGKNTNCNAGGIHIEDCIIGGWAAAGSIGIDVIGNGAPLTVLRNCHFNGIRDAAIKCTDSGTDQPRFWEIDRCTFIDNSNHIAMNPRGFKESWIHDCCFMRVGANYTATLGLDNRGGSNSCIGPNNFLSGNYDNGGGYYAGTAEFWRGNHSQDSENGSAQANPAA